MTLLQLGSVSSLPDVALIAGQHRDRATHHWMLGQFMTAAASRAAGRAGPPRYPVSLSRYTIKDLSPLP